jgi:putative ATP-binding cassette transporter
VSIPVGARLLVTGPNEAARVSLFRATAGLWHGGEGKMTRPPLDGILFLPQRPELPPVALRELLFEPGREVPDDRILEALRAAGLGPVLERAGGLDVERDWESFVSLGDQQLLALTRVILAGPRFAFLDRLETTLGPGQVQQALQRLAANSITPIHFAEAAGSEAQYDAVLEIDSDGAWAWRWTDAEPVRDRGEEIHRRCDPVPADPPQPSEAKMIVATNPGRDGGIEGPFPCDL